MPAKHKFQNARLSITTSLAPEHLTDLARHAGESVTNKVPGQAAVHVDDAYPMAVKFSTRTVGGRVQVMTFGFNALTDSSGATTGHSEITSFKTTQPKYMFIPVGPKSLLGWAQYKRFATNLADAVRAADSSARCEFVERAA